MAEDDEILSILGDEYSRKILSTLSKNEMSVQEISDNLGIPTSTTYRKIKNLETLGLVKKPRLYELWKALMRAITRVLSQELT
jgi:DNA-binding IclR family transcriptional regulator